MIESVNILGSEYRIVRKRFEDDPYFKDNECNGYCDGYIREIAICDMTSYPGYENEPIASLKIAEKQTLRHEIVHAFLDESGLGDNAALYNNAWAKNEEMVDWFALQGPKIYEAWKQAEAL